MQTAPRIEDDGVHGLSRFADVGRARGVRLPQSSSTSEIGAGGRRAQPRRSREMAPPMDVTMMTAAWQVSARATAVSLLEPERPRDDRGREVERAEVARPGRDRRGQRDARREERRLGRRQLDAQRLARGGERDDRGAPGEAAQDDRLDERPGPAGDGQPAVQLARRRRETRGQRSAQRDDPLGARQAVGRHERPPARPRAGPSTASPTRTALATRPRTLEDEDRERGDRPRRRPCR